SSAPPPAPKTSPITAPLPAPEPPSAWPSGGATTAVAPFCVPSYPDLVATTTPVRSAVTTTRPSPMAVIFQGFHPVLVRGELRSIVARPDRWSAARHHPRRAYP